MTTTTNNTPSWGNFFNKNRFYRTPEGDIGKLHYQNEERISLEMSTLEIEVHPSREVTLVRLNHKQKQKWFEEYAISTICNF
jgi:hypothetical protein